MKALFLSIVLACFAAHKPTEKVMLHNIDDMLLLGVGSSSVAPSGCSQATTFIARTSGMDATEQLAVTTTICELVTDGIITGALASPSYCGSVIDRLYWFPTNSAANANLDVCGSTDTLTANNSPTFTTDEGYTGNASSAYLSSAFVPSTAGGNWTLNSSTFGAYNLTSRSSGESSSIMGAGGTSGWSFFDPLDTNGKEYGDNDSFTFGEESSTSGNVQGQWIISRTASASFSSYHNGTLDQTWASSTSTALPNVSMFILATDNEGSGGTLFSSSQLAATWWGAGVDSTQAGQIDKAINDGMKVLGINVY